eukprot:5020411-Amphidinium_carterae.1
MEARSVAEKLHQSFWRASLNLVAFEASAQPRPDQGQRWTKSPHGQGHATCEIVQSPRGK